MNKRTLKKLLGRRIIARVVAPAYAPPVDRPVVGQQTGRADHLPPARAVLTAAQRAERWLHRLEYDNILYREELARENNTEG